MYNFPLLEYSIGISSITAFLALSQCFANVALALFQTSAAIIKILSPNSQSFTPLSRQESVQQLIPSTVAEEEVPPNEDENVRPEACLGEYPEDIPLTVAAAAKTPDLTPREEQLKHQRQKNRIRSRRCRQKRKRAVKSPMKAADKSRNADDGTCSLKRNLPEVAVIQCSPMLTPTRVPGFPTNSSFNQLISQNFYVI
ncbi:hypothetical protein EB796_014347 [Bugula neritina]|uniref:BZIP domain-containing protein n=1 Tax=Bugula neritina TaxID=10212 RepID=A0A7J7JNV7_BUGNE|nr:hypothetical protein EB796_014347 [Bugula neritina]